MSASSATIRRELLGPILDACETSQIAAARGDAGGQNSAKVRVISPLTGSGRQNAGASDSADMEARDAGGLDEPGRSGGNDRLPHKGLHRPLTTFSERICATTADVPAYRRRAH